jgi:transposase-like protein
MHRRPAGRFYQRNGSYAVSCRAHPVPRFRCKVCRKRFSRQTFRIDYRDRKPHLNGDIFIRLCSGTGLRRIAQALSVSRSTVERKFHKLGRQLRHLHRNAMGHFGGQAEFALDELETFETCRRTRPVTVPILIDQESFFVVDARSDTLPPRGRLDRRNRRRVQIDEARFGKRRNRSSRVVAEVLSTAAERCRGSVRIVVRSDRKTSYPGLLKRAFGAKRLNHVQVSSKAPRTTWNPLFRINLTNAMTRDLMGRLHRRSWLVSKERRYLDAHLALFTVHRNYIRSWRNGERETPAMMLGFMDRELTPWEAVGWRQDWGADRSVHPLGHPSQTVADYLRMQERIRELRAG